MSDLRSEVEVLSRALDNYESFSGEYGPESMFDVSKERAALASLEAENGRLREALETIGGTDEGQMLFGGIIRTALASITPEGGTDDRIDTISIIVPRPDPEGGDKE